MKQKKLLKDNPFKFTPSVIIFPLVFVAILWAVFITEFIFQIDLGHYGIYPRTSFGLKGIFFSPFLHGDLEHLFNNSTALFVLLLFLRYFYRKQSITVIILGIIFSGLGTWLIGRPSYHIGVSGLIYALVSFIFFKGIFTRYFRLIAVSLTVIVLYGGMIWYMFPKVGANNISWEGHLFGFLTGFVLAYFLKTPQFDKAIFYDWESPDFNPENDPFMKNFDENGTFNPPPKPEEVIKEYFNSSIKVIYDFIGIKKE